MSLIITDSQNYTNIANAIRTKNGTNNSYTPANMPNAILNLGGNWLGENPEYVKQVYALNTTLDQTGFASWTPSSTASVIKASETLSTKETLDLEHYDYIIKWVSDCNVVYDDTWTPIKGTCLREVTMYAQAIFQRPSSVSTIEDETFNYTAVQQGTYQIYWCKYYSSNTAISMAYTTYSPCYISALTAATFSSTSSLTPTLTIKTPALSARCSGTYFSTAQAAKVDQENTTVKLNGYLYRVKRGTSVAAQTWADLTDVYNHPL